MTEKRRLIKPEWELVDKGHDAPALIMSWLSRISGAEIWRWRCEYRYLYPTSTHLTKMVCRITWIINKAVCQL